MSGPEAESDRCDPPEAAPFAEPWQAQVFALTVRLHQEGVFTWSQWTSELSEALKDGPADDALYYEGWLTALERLLIKEGITTAATLKSAQSAWAQAIGQTPHGHAVTLAP